MHQSLHALSTDFQIIKLFTLMEMVWFLSGFNCSMHCVVDTYHYNEKMPHMCHDNSVPPNVTQFYIQLIKLIPSLISFKLACAVEPSHESNLALLVRVEFWVRILCYIVQLLEYRKGVLRSISIHWDANFWITGSKDIEQDHSKLNNIKYVKLIPILMMIVFVPSDCDWAVWRYTYHSPAM